MGLLKRIAQDLHREEDFPSGGFSGTERTSYMDGLSKEAKEFLHAWFGSTSMDPLFEMENHYLEDLDGFIENLDAFENPPTGMLRKELIAWATFIIKLHR